MGRKKKAHRFSDRVVAEAKRVLDFNLVNPLYKDDARLDLPEAQVPKRGFKFDGNTLVLVHLHHHRPLLFWDITVSWSDGKFLNPELAYELLRLFLTEDELVNAEVTMPTDSLIPCVNALAEYVPRDRELLAYDGMVRNREKEFDLAMLMGAPAPEGDSPIITHH